MDILKKSILMIFFISFIFSCKSAKLIKAERQKVLPGVSNGTVYFKYDIKLEINKETKFINIKLNDHKLIEKFSVVNLESNVQSDNMALYPKGKYSLQFNVDNNEQKEIVNNDILIEYKQNNKSKFLKTEAKIVEVLQLK